MNAVCLLAGFGLLPLLGVVRGRADFRRRGLLAYPLGLSSVGIMTATLAAVGARANVPELVLFTVLLVSLGAVRFALRSKHDIGEWRTPHERAGRLGDVAALTAGALAVAAGWWAMTRPLSDWDAWAIWWPHALALFRWGSADNPMILGGAYPHPTYPLLLPSLDALDFRAAGTPSIAAFHLQAVAFSVAFAAGYWALLRQRTSRKAAGITMLAIFSAPGVFLHMMTGYADIPLALLTSLAMVSLAMWLVEGQTWYLAVASVFLAAAALTKNEGQMFAVAAVVSAGIVAHRCGRQRRYLLVPLLSIAAVLAPWKFFLHQHRVSETDFKLADLVNISVVHHHWDRAIPALSALASASNIVRWSTLPILALIALSAAIGRHELGIPIFLLTWVGLSVGALVDIYVVSPLPLHWYLDTSADRVVSTLVIACASVAPILMAPIARARPRQVVYDAERVILA